MNIYQINVVYGLGKAQYVFVDFIDEAFTPDSITREQIDLEQLPAYIARFEQQSLLNNGNVNFDKSLFTYNGNEFNSIAITFNPSGGLTPPPGAAAKNIVVFNGSNIGTIDVLSITDLAGYNFITGVDYNSNLPITNNESVRGDLTTLPQSGTAIITLDAAGLAGATDLRIYAFGESLKSVQYVLNNGAAQDFNFDFDVSFGGSLFIAIFAGAQPSGVLPVPPVRQGVLLVQTNRNNYLVNTINAVKLPNSGIVLPVQNTVQFGTWHDNTANTITINATNNSVIAGGAVAYCQVNGVYVDQKILPLGTGDLTFNNVPNPIPNGQSVRISIFGV